MKQLFLLVALASTFCNSNAQKPQAEQFDLILKTEQIPGKINQTVAHQLTEPLKAIAAYYGAMAGSNCNGTSCELTTALGLGNQGSEAHKSILGKWFKKDKTAKQLLKQDCYLPPNTSSSFNDFAYLRIQLNDNTVTVSYQILFYNQGKSTFVTSDTDQLLIKDNTIIVKRKKIWQ